MGRLSEKEKQRSSTEKEAGEQPRGDPAEIP
jgi:hypothetical protein